MVSAHSCPSGSEQQTGRRRSYHGDAHLGCSCTHSGVYFLFEANASGTSITGSDGEPCASLEKRINKQQATYFVLFYNNDILLITNNFLFVNYFCQPHSDLACRHPEALGIQSNDDVRCLFGSDPTTTWHTRMHAHISHTSHAHTLPLLTPPPLKTSVVPATVWLSNGRAELVETLFIQL